jgi:hypothetical protein
MLWMRREATRASPIDLDSIWRRVTSSMAS